MPTGAECQSPAPKEGRGLSRAGLALAFVEPNADRIEVARRAKKGPLEGGGPCVHSSWARAYTTPCAIIESATLMKPATLAPFT